MTLEEDYSAIDNLDSKQVLPTKLIIGVIALMFIGVQLIFLFFRPSEEAMWQATGMIVSTNFAAVWLTIRGNQQIEDVQESAKRVYRPEILKFVNWLYALFQKMGDEMDEDPQEILDELAPLLSKVLIRHNKEKRRLERLSKIEDDEVFMSAMEEVLS